jgi:hypothetical protein
VAIRTDQEEGQVVLPLLLVVVALLFFGLVYFQVGAAVDQKVQAQTAGDSGVVAAVHVIRDDRIARTARTMPFSFAGIFAGIPGPATGPAQAACSAAVRNWASGPHQGRSIGCGDVSLTPTVSGARVRLRSPTGVIADGPVDLSGQDVRSAAQARVTDIGCPGSAVVARAGAKAVADWVMDTMMASLGGASSCLTGQDISVLQAMDKKPWTAPAAIGDPRAVLTAVRRATQVEIID